MVVFVLMLAEARLSWVHERGLRAAGALEPPGDVYATMAWAYPISFLAMAVEGALAGRTPGTATWIGAGVFAAAKALKYWAMRTLGTRWTFRVLVPPRSSLVTSGPYAYMNHPNYVAVMGELIGVAILVDAPVTGVAAVCGFGWLVRRRLLIEERALGR